MLVGGRFGEQPKSGQELMEHSQLSVTLDPCSHVLLKFKKLQRPS
ncbi:hypothetical protein TAMC210_02490 [Thermanaeromonas sp. C210]|nr:hypothetical protein TAMC210_02490 [Thermanaeromonas sp. C210]